MTNIKMKRDYLRPLAESLELKSMHLLNQGSIEVAEIYGDGEDYID